MPKHAFLATGEAVSEHEYSVDDVQSDAGQIALLIAMGRELHWNAPHDVYDLEHRRERIGALLRAAQRCADDMVQSIETNIVSMRANR